MARSDLGIRRHIIYLDTSLIVELTKARLGGSLVSYERLYDALSSLVSAGRALCPRVVLRDLEVDHRMDGRAFQETVSILSRGLEMRHHDEILHAQVDRAVYQYRGQEALLKPRRWAEAFSCDPDGIDPMDWIITAHTPVTTTTATRIREAKAQYETDVASVLKSADTGTLESCFTDELEGFVQSRWTNLKARIALAWYFTRKVENADDKDIGSFFESAEFKAVPFVQIMCLMYAGCRHYFPNRLPRGSDAYDFRIIPTVLPYCDIVTCDKFVKDLDGRPRIGLISKFGAALYSTTPDGVEALTRKLAQLAA